MTDNEGKPVAPVVDASGEAIPTATNEEGKPVPAATDASGEPVIDDKGENIPASTDEEGNPKPDGAKVFYKPNGEVANPGDEWFDDKWDERVKRVAETDNEVGKGKADVGR